MIRVIINLFNHTTKIENKSDFIIKMLQSIKYFKTENIAYYAYLSTFYYYTQGKKDYHKLHFTISNLKDMPSSYKHFETYTNTMIIINILFQLLNNDDCLISWEIIIEHHKEYIQSMHEFFFI